MNPEAVEVFLITEDGDEDEGDVIGYCIPPGVIIPPYIRVNTMNMLMKERTINLYQPV
jgi:hypothetical protein